MTGTTYIIGAGLAGLSAAVDLARAGRKVELIESANQAGGRCRSYFDSALGRIIDNGNHLVLSGNRATFDYLRKIGAEHSMNGPNQASFVFADLRDGSRFKIHANDGALAWWVLSDKRRVPGTRLADYLSLLGLLTAKSRATVRGAMPAQGPLWDRLMNPFLLAALNTEPSQGSARLAGAIIRETLAKGGKHYYPRIAEPNLGACFIDPALTMLKAHGAKIRMGLRLRQMDQENGAITALHMAEVTRLEKNDQVILAVPPWIAGELCPGLSVPDSFNPIINAHYLIAPPADLAPIIGVLGGTAEWIFSFPDRISVTVSNAAHLVDLDRESIARQIWADIAKVHHLGAEMPPWQIVKEKRATFAATPEQDAKRPNAATTLRNLTLAGDWVSNGLPATIEGAIRSGQTAARLVLQSPSL